MNDWEILGIQPTANEREIKKAYARQTKIHHPETDPEGFQLVYKAYQRILKTTNTSKHIEVIPFDSNVLSERKVFQKEEKRVPSRNLKNEQYNIYKDIENEQYEKLKNSEKGKSKKSRNNKDDIYKNIENEQYEKLKNSEKGKSKKSRNNKDDIYKNIENEQHEKIKKIEKDQQKREKQYFELVFDNLIDFVEEEKRNYYNRPAMVEFGNIFLDPNKIYYQDPWRKYFESFQFLEIQYDGKFIKYLTEFLEEQQEVEIRKIPKNLYIELCTAYGILTDSEVYKFADVKPLIDIMNIHYLKTDYTNMMTKHKEILERRYSFYMYISLVKEYEKNTTNTVIYWIKILEDITYEVSKEASKRITIKHSNNDMIYPDIKRIPLIFELLTHFLEIHKPISKELHYAFYLLFEKRAIRNGGDELEIMLLTLRDMRSTEVQQYITQEDANGKNLEYVKNLELEEKRVKSNELVYTRVIFNENKKENSKIKKHSIGFVLYQICIGGFLGIGTLLALLGCLLELLDCCYFSWDEILEIFVATGYMLSIVYLLYDIIPYKIQEKRIKRYLECCPFSYWITYNNDYWIVDETNGKLIVVVKKNPFKFQEIDISYIEKIAVYPDLFSQQRSQTVKIGVEIWIFGKKYFAYTFNGKRAISSRYIGVNSGTAQLALKKAQNLFLSLSKAKEKESKK